MSGDVSDFETSLSLDVACHIDRLCDAFEAAWIAGPRPQIDDYLLGASDKLRHDLLRELLQIDLFYRRRQGENPSPATTRHGFPTLKRVGWKRSSPPPDNRHREVAGWPDRATFRRVIRPHRKR